MENYLSIYGFRGFVKLVKDVINTKLFFPKCRLVRTPYYIKRKGKIKFGKGFTSGVGMRIDVPYVKSANEIIIEIGENVQVNDYVHITAVNSIKIGNNVLIASKVFITDHNHGGYNEEHVLQSHPDEPPADRPITFKSVTIEDNVWIGEFVTVLPGVTIGKGSIIGSMSVVSKNIPPDTIAVGSPARAIKKFNRHTGVWEKI